MSETSIRIPVPALVLGVLGVVPFVGLDLAAVSRIPIAGIPIVSALSTYAAIILSFMGGAQWGLAVGRYAGDTIGLWRRFGISVLPALIGWAALLPPARMGLCLLAAAFALLAAYDLWSVAQGDAPAWYGRLRLYLSTAVVACLAVVVVFARLA